MGAMGVKHEDGSPFARAARELTALAYHVVPIIPPGASHPAAGKAPGKFTAGEWRGLGEWERFRDRAPTEFELTLWSANYPDANIGVVCGSPAGDGLVVIAVDIDTNDFEEIDILLGALPHAVMSKKGAKGQTLFYRAPADIKSKSYDLGVRPHARRVLDLLTGSQTRQTVAPPSNHASGAVYRWLSGPAPAHDLTVFDETALEKLEDTLASLGWNPDAMRATRAANASRAPLDPDDIWGETKSAALVRLVDWAPHLGLYNLRRARAGFEAVATWRDSSTGRPLEQRKRNLSIQPTGIKDFGTGETFSPLDLVMRAQGCDLETATAWLRARLGFDDTPVMVLAPAKASAQPVETMDPETGEIVVLPGIAIAPPAALPLAVAPAPRGLDDELPDRLTRVTGLLGALTDWISDTARRPQRGLALGAALAIMSGAAGRRYGGPTRTGAHLYVLGVAKTSAGKDHPLALVSRVLLAANLKSRVGPSQFMSMSAVINRMTREPVTVAAIDEFGSFMQRVNGRRASTHEKAISGVLRTFWGASFETVNPPEWAGRSSEPIHAPALSIFGVSTPEEFYASLEGGDVHNGFLNRFLLISTRRRPAEVDPKTDKANVPGSIVAGLIETAAPNNVLAAATSHHGRADGPEITAPWACPEAHACYRAFGREIEGREADVSFLARTVEMAQRLALLKAIGDDPVAPRITLADMEWGRAVALWSGERMIAETRDYLADTQNQADAQLVLRIIRDHQRITRRELRRKLQHRIKGRDLEDVIKGLVESCEVGFTTEPATHGGQPTVWYYPV